MPQRTETVGEPNYWRAVRTTITVAAGPLILCTLLSLQVWQLLMASATHRGLTALQAQQDVLLYLVLEKVPEQSLGKPTEKGVPAGVAGVQ